MAEETRSPVTRPAPTEHEIHELIAGRWSSRAIDPGRPVEKATIQQLLEAARWAPSAFNNQSWQYLVVTTDDPAAMEKARSALFPGNAWALNAPALIFSMARERHARNDKLNRFHGYEAGMATILMAIQATALGLMFHQMAGYSPKTLRELFEIPDEYVIFTAIAVGYPGTIGQTPEKDRAGESAPRERVPQEQFSHWNGW